MSRNGGGGGGGHRDIFLPKLVAPISCLCCAPVHLRPLCVDCWPNNNTDDVDDDDNSSVAPILPAVRRRPKRSAHLCCSPVFRLETFASLAPLRLALLCAARLCLQDNETQSLCSINVTRALNLPNMKCGRRQTNLRICFAAFSHLQQICAILSTYTRKVAQKPAQPKALERDSKFHNHKRVIKESPKFAPVSLAPVLAAAATRWRRERRARQSKSRRSGTWTHTDRRTDGRDESRKVEEDY